MSFIKPTYKALQKRLAIAEPIVEALKRQEVDAVVGHEKITFLLLKEVGDELQNCQIEFRTMFDLPGIGMFQANTPAMRLTRVNKKLCEMLGYSSEELHSKTYIGLTDPRDQQRDMKKLSSVLRGKTDSWSIEKRCICKDKSSVWVCVNGSALRDASGRVVKVMAMISDISTRQQTKSVIA